MAEELLNSSLFTLRSSFSLCCLFNLFMFHNITIAAMTAAEKSEIGILYHTPSISQIIGRKARSGRRMSNCLDKERKMLIFTFPIHWKKFVMTIWNPMTGKQNITTLIALMPRSNSVLSVVKSLAQ